MIIKQLYFISILLVLFFSCKNISNKKGNYIPLNKIENKNQIIDKFIDSLKSLPIKDVPISKNWKNFKKQKFPTDLINKKNDSNNVLNNNNLIFNKPEGLKNINKITQEYAENYYYLLFMKSMQTKYFFLERLKPLNDKIEVFINYSKIIGRKGGDGNGILLKLNILDTKKKVILNSYFITIFGIAVNAENDSRFFEGFMIDKDYNIKIKSYTSIEGESTEIKKEIKILQNGTFSNEKIDIKIITEENGETYIENFSKEIKH